MASKLGNKKINLSVQLLHLKRLFPQSHIHIQHNFLVWEGQIMPTQLSQVYTVRLSYKLAKSPQVNVLKPELIVPEGKSLPHTYPGERLCLYYPGIGDWRGDTLLAETIVPWISEWLYYYEIWLVTGEWYGGGIHPRRKNRH
jgi:hypothetical protein